GSFNDDPLVRAAHQRGTAVGPAYATRGFDGQRILRASMDVTEARSPHGVLRGQVNLDFVGLDLGSFTVTRSPDVFYLIDGTGHLVARSDAPEDVSLPDVSRLPEVKAAFRQGERPRPSDQQAIHGVDLRGRSVLATSLPLPLLRWYFIAIHP